MNCWPCAAAVDWHGQPFLAVEHEGTLLPEADESRLGFLPHMHHDQDARYPRAVVEHEPGDCEPEEDTVLEQRGVKLGRRAPRALARAPDRASAELLFCLQPTEFILDKVATSQRGSTAYQKHAEDELTDSPCSTNSQPTVTTTTTTKPTQWQTQYRSPTDTTTTDQPGREFRVGVHRLRRQRRRNRAKSFPRLLTRGRDGHRRSRSGRSSDPRCHFGDALYSPGERTVRSIRRAHLLRRRTDRLHRRGERGHLDRGGSWLCGKHRRNIPRRRPRRRLTSPAMLFSQLGERTTRKRWISPAMLFSQLGPVGRRRCPKPTEPLTAKTVIRSASEETCDKDTYQHRLWCRVRLFSHYFRRGRNAMYRLQKDSTLASVDRSWLLDALFAFEGDCTYCLRKHEGRKCDRWNIFEDLIVQSERRCVQETYIFGSSFSDVQSEGECLSMLLPSLARPVSSSQYVFRNFLLTVSSV